MCTCIRKCISFSREQDLKKDIIVNSCIKIHTVGDKESTCGYRESGIETGRRMVIYFYWYARLVGSGEGDENERKVR